VYRAADPSDVHEGRTAQYSPTAVDTRKCESYGKQSMPREQPKVDVLMRKLLRAITVSLSATEAAREAVQEILRRGADTGIFFAGAKARGNPSFEMTQQDREFLRAVSIRPDR